jgi:hypothetical protein
MTREYRIFEVDKYDNRWFVCRHSSLDSAKHWLKVVAPALDEGASFKIFDETGEECID